jgi:hypothetical protein
MGIYHASGGSRGLNSGPQVQWQASLPTEPLPTHDFRIPFPVEFHSGSGGYLGVPPVTLCLWLTQCGLSSSSEEYKGQTGVSGWDRSKEPGREGRPLEQSILGEGRPLEQSILGEDQPLEQSILGEGQQLGLREFENRWL